MISEVPGLLEQVRDRFAHIDTCPFSGPRIFFENAGGALTLKSVVETSGLYASYPDNQGRINAASTALQTAIDKGRADMRLWMNAPDGQVFVGESGTEVLFRLVRTAALGAEPGGTMLGTTLEHPASRSAMSRWADVTGRPLTLVAHDDATGTVDVEAWLPHITPDLRVASIVHTSPVTGISVDVNRIVAAIRDKAPDCFIIVDGIQHASHGGIDLEALNADGYAVSPYKVFSRHGYGIGWASDRLTACTKETLVGSSPTGWEQGTRDAGSYATFSDVVDHFLWLGGLFTESTDPRTRIEAAATAIHAQEQILAQAMIEGTHNQRGLADIPGVTVLGGLDNPGREGVVSLTLDTMDAASLVQFLEDREIRVHIRKNDTYCGNVLGPLGIDTCIRVSFSHYNSPGEVSRFLTAMNEAAGA